MHAYIYTLKRVGNGWSYLRKRSSCHLHAAFVRRIDTQIVSEGIVQAQQPCLVVIAVCVNACAEAVAHVLTNQIKDVSNNDLLASIKACIYS